MRKDKLNDNVRVCSFKSHFHFMILDLVWHYSKDPLSKRAKILLLSIHCFINITKILDQLCHIESICAFTAKCVPLIWHISEDLNPHARYKLIMFKVQRTNTLSFSLNYCMKATSFSSQGNFFCYSTPYQLVF